MTLSRSKFEANVKATVGDLPDIRFRTTSVEIPLYALVTAAVILDDQFSVGFKRQALASQKDLSQGFLATGDFNRYTVRNTIGINTEGLLAIPNNWDCEPSELRVTIQDLLDRTVRSNYKAWLQLSYSLYRKGISSDLLLSVGFPKSNRSDMIAHCKGALTSNRTSNAQFAWVLLKDGVHVKTLTKGSVCHGSLNATRQDVGIIVNKVRPMYRSAAEPCWSGFKKWLANDSHYSDACVKLTKDHAVVNPKAIQWKVAGFNTLIRASVERPSLPVIWDGLVNNGVDPHIALILSYTYGTGRGYDSGASPANSTWRTAYHDQDALYPYQMRKSDVRKFVEGSLDGVSWNDAGSNKRGKLASLFSSSDTQSYITRKKPAGDYRTVQQCIDNLTKAGLKIGKEMGVQPWV